MQDQKESRSRSNLSDKLCLLLKLHGVTESELARKLSIPYNTIHRILTGETVDPRMSTVHLISEFFKISIDELIHGSPINTQLPEGNASLTVPIGRWEDLGSILFTQKKSDHDLIRESMQIMAVEGVSNPDNLLALRSTKSMTPRFPNGTVFIIDQEAKPMDGDLLLVNFKETESYSLRELNVDSPNWILLPIVYGSEAIPLSFDEHMIAGVVILTVIDTRNA